MDELGFYVESTRAIDEYKRLVHCNILADPIEHDVDYRTSLPSIFYQQL